MVNEGRKIAKFRYMPTFQKIPVPVKEKGCIASGRYCVFASLMEAGDVFLALEQAEQHGAIPVVGYVTIKGKRYHYCLYGLVDNPDVYAK